MAKRGRKQIPKELKSATLAITLSYDLRKELDEYVEEHKILNRSEFLSFIIHEWLYKHNKKGY